MSQVALPQMSAFAQLLKQGWGQAAAVNSLGCGGGKPLSASRTQSVTIICLQPITTWLMLKLLKLTFSAAVAYVHKHERKNETCYLSEI